MAVWAKLGLLLGFSITCLGTQGSKFTPAAPGETPKCANKGKSFCEYVDGYPSHVITYLLEHGMFDTNTLFSSEVNSKPPKLNKTEDVVEPVQSRGLPMIRLRHKPLPVRYPGPSKPSHHPNSPPVFHKRPQDNYKTQFSQQIYADYLNYYKRRNQHLYPSPTPLHGRTPNEPIFLSDLPARNLETTKKIAQEDKDLKGAKEASPEADTPYTYKVLDGDAVGIRTSPHHDISKIELPSRAYIPPASHNTIHNHGGLTGHLRVPQQAYLPPSDAAFYRIPKTYHAPKEPAKSYLPPAKSYLPPPAPLSKSYLPPPPPSPHPTSIQPAYLQPHHGDDEVQLVPHNDVLTIALPLHSTVQPYSLDTKPTHHPFVPHKPATIVHHQPTKAPQYPPYHNHQPSPAPVHHQHPTPPPHHPPHPSRYPHHPFQANKYPHHHPSPTPQHPHHFQSPQIHQQASPLHPPAIPKHLVVHSLPPRRKFSIADYIRDDGEYDADQNEVTFSNKARLQQTLRSFQSKVKKEVKDEKETSKSGRLANKISDQPEKEFEKLRIAVDIGSEEENILFSTTSQGGQIQETTDAGQESSSEGEQVTTTTTTTTTTAEEEKSTTADITTPAATTTTEPETPRSTLPNQNTRVVPSTHVRFPQDRESEGRHSSVAFGPQLPLTHQDSQLAQGLKDSRPPQAQPVPQPPQEKQTPQQGPGLPEGTISFQPRHPDPILQESLVISARGGRTVQPRSFTPPPQPRDSGTHRPRAVVAGSSGTSHNSAHGTLTAAGEVVHKLEQTVFPGADHKVDAFLTKADAGSHSYRLTTPSSHVFVQRTFGTTAQPFKRETVSIRNQAKDDSLEDARNDQRKTSIAVDKKDEEESTMYQTLRDAVDVLTRSSLGFMYQQPEGENEASTEAMLAALQLESLTNEENELSEELDEVEQELRQELHILQRQLGGEGEIEIRLPDDGGERQHLRAIVEDQEDFPLQSLLLSAPRVGPSFEHFPVQNIFDKESIERLLDGIAEEEKSENLPVIGKEQLDDLLLTNYLKNSLANTDQQPDVFLNEPTEEKNVFERKSKSLGSGSLESTDNSLDQPMQVEELVLVPYNSTVYVPLDRIETIGVGDTTEKNSKDIGDSQEFVEYMEAPSLTTVKDDAEEEKKAVTEPPKELDDLITAENAEVEKRIEEGWGGEPIINMTFQDKWIGHSESPVEVERKKRQLEAVLREGLRRQKREDSVETSDVDEVLEAGEVLLDQMERDVVRDIELEQEFSHLMEEEADQQARDRRQTSDPDQLCPTLATFVMPRAGINAQGNWMYIVNMPDDVQYQQFVRSEVCISSSCRGLCDVPPGLTTKCSQQFVQKKMVALHPSGDRLVEDMFWFPSCCVCQVTRESRS